MRVCESHFLRSSSTEATQNYREDHLSLTAQDEDASFSSNRTIDTYRQTHTDCLLSYSKLFGLD